MSDYLSGRAAIIAAVDDLDQAALDGNAGPVSGPIVKLSAQLASVGSLQTQIATLQGQLTTLQGQVVTLTGERDARQAAIDKMKIAAKQDQDDDDAKRAGSGVLAAAGTF